MFFIIDNENEDKKEDLDENYNLDVATERHKLKRNHVIQFDWIRRKRSLLSAEYFDKYERDDYGIYRRKRRRHRRTTDLSDVYDGLTNLPSFELDKVSIVILY